MKKLAICHLYTTTIATLLLLSALLLISKSKAKSLKQALPNNAPHQQSSVSSPTPNAIVTPLSKSGDPESVEDLSGFIREISAQGGDANTLYARVVAMKLTKQGLRGRGVTCQKAAVLPCPVGKMKPTPFSQPPALSMATLPIHISKSAIAALTLPLAPSG